MDLCAVDLWAFVAGVDHGRYVDALRHKIARGFIAVVVVGEDQNRFCGSGSPAVGVSAHGACHHNAGAVVVGETDVALDGACRDNRAFGIDAPHGLARFACTGGNQVIRVALQSAIDPVIIGPKHRRARHDPHVWQRRKFGLSGCGPVAAGLVCDGHGFGQEAATEHSVFFGKDNTCTGSSGCQSGHQSGRA